MKTEELIGKKLLKKGEPKETAKEIIKVKENGETSRVYFSTFDGMILTSGDIEKIESGEHDNYELLTEPAFAKASADKEKIEPTNGQDAADKVMLTLNKTKEVEILSDAKQEIERLKSSDEDFNIEQVNKYLEERYPEENPFDIAKISELALSLVEL